MTNLDIPFTPNPNIKGIKFFIDRGGTFTDCLAEIPIDGKAFKIQYKLLSEDPRNYKDAPTEGIRRILEKVSGTKYDKDTKLDTSRISAIRMATTVATNALLERKGEKFALIVTNGFKDILKIGNQSRQDIFDLEIKKLDVLYDTVVEVNERVTIAGYSAGGDKTMNSQNFQSFKKGITGEAIEVIKPLDDNEIREKLLKLRNEGFESVAVVLMHSYTFPEHEQRIGEICKTIGFKNITLSSELDPMIKIVSRGMSTCVDAYLTPVIKRYLNNFVSGFDENLLKKVEVLFMQSDGSLSDIDRFSGFRAILSGPAGGVVGFSKTSFIKDSVIGFDMGGTSTDVSFFTGEHDYSLESEIAGISIQAPQLSIQTVAAGGGSRLFFKNGLLAVGPDSVGANPGPACYRKGGSLAVTDANLVLGRLVPKFFPRIFGPNENELLDDSASKDLFQKLLQEIQKTFPFNAPKTIEELAIGFIQVANESMCRPIRQITHGKGYDTKNSILTCFGGAGGQHACSIARKLGIRTVYVHKFASVLSAYGLSLADLAFELQEPCYFIFDSSLHEIRDRLSKLKHQTIEKFDKHSRPELVFEYFLNIRYEGTEGGILVKGFDVNFDFGKAFIEQHNSEFGFSYPLKRLLVLDLKVRAIRRTTDSDSSPEEFKFSKVHECKLFEESTQVYFADYDYLSTPVVALSKMKPGDYIKGPALIIDRNTTVLVDPDSTGIISLGGHIVLDVAERVKKDISVATADPVLLSIFSHRFMSIAEQMGKTLQRTSVSTNIKERLDFSCALFGADGGLIANAPHIPVHLGSMQEAVKYQISLHGNQLKPGDVLISNHPKAGGSHLPDITIITPSFHKEKIVFFVASRGHHADIGGISPGSMPPHSKFLFEEGCVIESFKLVENGVFKEKEMIDLLVTEPAKFEGCSGSRNISDNLSDLKAQVAANLKGIKLIEDLISEYSENIVSAYMSFIRENAESAVRKLLRELANLHGSVFQAEDYMDDGSIIRLRVQIEATNGTALFDFSGTSEQVYGNLNAPISVTYSAIIYCLRCMVKDDIPLNQGCLSPIAAIIPEGSIINPTLNLGVVGGNVLTSQRLVDVIFKAFKSCAASQGCMNNLTFGESETESNSGWGYYETIAGGAGAGPTWNGESGVHTHMTNTRITDPEILERRYPVILKRFGIRDDQSGGDGLYKGGEGVIREIDFRMSLSVSILSERRIFRPYGLEGGQDGKQGKNSLIKEGRKINIGGKCNFKVSKGDVLLIETPGGGGFGVAK